MAVVSDYTALLSGSSWTSGPMGQAVQLTYSFSTSATSFLQANNAAAAATFVPLTDDEKTTVRAALAQWSAVGGVTFHEVTSTPGDITFGLYDLSTLGGSDDAGLGNYPSTGLYTDSNGKLQTYSNFPTQGGDVYFDAGYAAVAGTDFAHVALHEIGHALGLKHPFDTPGNTLTDALNNGSETVMAYAGIRSTTLEPLDIAAIQALYGTRSGATVPFPETWNAATESLTETGTSAAQFMFGSGGDDVFFSNGGRDAISGGEGDDIIYASGAPISVNGGPGTDTVVTGLTYTSGTTIGGSGSFRYIYLPTVNDFQIYANVERLDFTNGVYDLTTNTFSSVQPGTYSWTGDVDTAWSTPGNWKALAGGSAALAPGSADAVTVATTGTVSGSGQAASLALGGAPTLSGSFVVGSLAAGAGSLTVAGGGVLASTGAATLAGGLITVAATASVVEVGGHGFAAGGSGTFELDAGGTISGYGTINANTIDNYGTIIATGGTLRLIGTQAVATPGASRIAAGATLWVQNLHGAYSFTGAGGTLRTDTPDVPLGLVPTLGGFVAGDSLVLSGTLATASYTATGPGTGTLTADGVSLTLLGDYSQSQFTATASAATNTTTVTVAPRPVPADPLFDAAFYLARNPDVKAAGIDPYTHYLTYGWREGRDPSPLFSTNYYLSTNPDVKAAGLNPLSHYEQYGFREPRNPDAWFDSSYYLAQNPDVKAAGVNPLLHYLQNGGKEGRDPSLLFSDSKYLAASPDVASVGMNPLVHFIYYGQAEGRVTALAGGSAAADPLVNAAFYDRQLGATLLPAGPAAAQQAAFGYDATGWQQGLNPDAWFDTSYYLAHNPDVAAAHVDPLAHYEAFGWKEGRDASAQFSTTKYLASYADVKAAGMDPLLHFVAYGQAEGRTAFSV